MTSPSDHFTVTCKHHDERLDKVLSSSFPNYSRTYFQYLIENGSVLVNGKPVKKRIHPKEGDTIEIFFLHFPKLSLKPQNIPLDILYEDDHLICINKPRDMVVHPAPGHSENTFVNALLHHCTLETQDPEDIRPGIVHRLDKDTSGVLIAAKTRIAHQKLIVLFSERKIKKEYLAITIGNPKVEKIEMPIGRHPKKRKEMTILSETGKEAITLFKTVQFNHRLALVKILLVTGRTHQIRVHLKYNKTPILGDPLYGNHKVNEELHVKKQLLHASRIHLPHPLKPDHLLDITAPIPKDMEKWVEKI